MALIRRDAPRPQGEPTSCLVDLEKLRAELLGGDAERRWQAARTLGDEPGAVTALGDALAVERDPRICEAIFTSLIRLRGPEAAAVLLPFLRSEDAALRNGAIEALQSMPVAVMPKMPALLADSDPDVRLLAAELARMMPADTATMLLCQNLDVETHPNVCGAVVEVLAEVGTKAAAPALRRARDRFASDPFLPMAIGMVLSRLDPFPGSDGPPHG